MIYYFDNCATTKVDDEIKQIIDEFMCERYFNPSSLNKKSLDVKKCLNASREKIKNALKFSGDVYFTSGGTEADNLAVLGAPARVGQNVIVTKVEHSAVFNAVCALQNKGVEIRYAKTFDDGHVDGDSFLSLVDDKTALAVCMHVNNETGAVNDVAKLFSDVKKINAKTLCFADGVQALGKIPVKLDLLNADLYSFSSHKIHCAKGVGALCVRNGVRLTQINFGGGQENGVRNGTENVASAVALGVAVENAVGGVEEHTERFMRFKRIVLKALEGVDGVKTICSTNCSPAILTLAFACVKSQVLMNMLDDDDVVVGLGSACSAKFKVSRVHEELHLPKNFAEGLIRLSFSKYNDESQVDFLAGKLVEKVAALRSVMGVKN